MNGRRLNGKHLNGHGRPKVASNKSAAAKKISVKSKTFGKTSLKLENSATAVGSDQQAAA